MLIINFPVGLLRFLCVDLGVCCV